MSETQPYIKGIARLYNEKGECIGYETVVFYNPNYKLPIQETAGSSECNFEDAIR